MSTRTYDFEKPWRARDFLARIIGFGLILSEGQAHRKQRRALTPAFNIKNIRALYGLMWEKTGLLLDELETEMRSAPFDNAGKGRIEMSVWASRLTLDIIGPASSDRPQWAATFARCITPRTKWPTASWLSWSHPGRRWPS